MTTAGTPSTTPTATPTAPYKLMRASKGRMLAGVAAGLAKASGLDVTVVRVLIGASMLSGLGIIGYILLWIVLPDESPSRGRVIAPAPENTARTIRITLVVVAILGALHRVGVVWPFANTQAHTDFGFDGVFGLILLSIGVGVLFSRHRPDRGWWDASPPPTPGPAPTTTVAPPAPAGDDATTDTDTEADTDLLPLVDDTPTYESIGLSYQSPTRPVGTEAEPTERRRGAALGWARAFGWFVLLWWLAGVLGFVALWRFGALSIDSPVVIGVACWSVFTAVLNTLIRVRNPSAVLGSLFLLLIPGVIGLATVKAEGPAGTRTVRPIAASDVHRSYRQSIGELELDFSATRFSTKHPTTVEARIGAGGMIITVPDNVALTVNSKIQTGGYDILAKRTAAGVGQTETLRFAGCEGAPRLRLHLKGGAGWIQVKRANGHENATCAAPAA